MRVSGSIVPLLWRGGPKGRGGLPNFLNLAKPPRPFGADGSTGGEPRHAYLADLVDENGEVIDRAIVIYFQAPNSFTGEDVIEFHTHGSSAVIEKLFATLRAHGARMAEPGEFSRRAFDNGKMDLVEVDGLVSLLDARTDKQRAAALKSMAGADSAVYENWRQQMLEISAFAAAILDYPSDDLPQNIGENLTLRTKKLHTEISNAISRYAAARCIQSGFNIAIVGETNVGKSSLFNRLVGESRAIVSDIPGTTRDVVSAEIDIDGYLVRLSDTAGLRETNDTIEKIGIEKTNKEIENADLVMLIAPFGGLSAKRTGGVNESNTIIIYNKCDLYPPTVLRTEPPKGGNYVSALTGEGIPELLERIKSEVHARLDGAESDIAVNERTRGHLIAACDELVGAYICAPSVANATDNIIATNAAIGRKYATLQSVNYDIFAEHVRRAADEIGQILGVIGASEIADKVFGQLCLGK